YSTGILASTGISSFFNFLFFFLLSPPPPTSTLFPYTTLFRSVTEVNARNLRGIVKVAKGCQLLVNASASVFNEIVLRAEALTRRDRKSTRLNSSHRTISYAVFCLKKKKKITK